MSAQVEDHMIDSLDTTAGQIQIELLGHASLRFLMGDRLIYIDPAMELFRKEDFGKVDLILVTHSHRDHFQTDLIEKLKKPDGRVFLSKDCASAYPSGTVLNNGDFVQYSEITIHAVPAYNVHHKRENGEPYHARGVGNGYVLAFASKRIYVAGDTEAILEMKDIVDVDVAFLPANLPYTMDKDMFLKAVELINPKRVYPYHYKFGTSILNDVLPLLKEKNIDFRVHVK